MGLAASSKQPAARPLAILSRLVAAGAGGYVLASLVATVLPLALPMRRAEGVLTSTLIANLVFAGAIIMVYAIRRLQHAWTAVLAPSLVLAMITTLARHAARG